MSDDGQQLMGVALFAVPHASGIGQHYGNRLLSLAFGAMSRSGTGPPKKTRELRNCSLKKNEGRR